MTGKFTPGRYEDSYRAALLKVIRKKAKGKTIEAPKPKKHQEQPDLVEALQASLKSTRAQRKAPARRRTKRKQKAG